jgi:signal peptidase I
MRTALPAAFVALLINVFVTQAMVVQGPSMKPNLSYNHGVIVEKVTYRFAHGPRRGDVVVIDMPEEKELLVKRAVALPGETVAVQDQGGIDYPPTLVPPLRVFVLGDNREESWDSRYFGPVPVDQIGGQVKFIIWPLDRIGGLR